MSEEVLRQEIETQVAINAALRHEIGILKEQVRARDAVMQAAFQLSRDALMTPANLTRLGRERRDQAITEINYKLGAFVR